MAMFGAGLPTRADRWTVQSLRTTIHDHGTGSAGRWRTMVVPVGACIRTLRPGTTHGRVSAGTSSAANARTAASRSGVSTYVARIFTRYFGT